MSTHELSSNMLYIHPPLAIAGHALIFIFTVSLILIQNKQKSTIKSLGVFAWLFTFLGLVTGIIWAQLAWGSFWSWDPKETLTLILFSTFSTTLLFYFENKVRITTWLSLCSCVLVVITVLSSFIIAGLHSFIYLEALIRFFAST
ncbi:MAG: cytochrome c biogenesis protein [Candidatus Bathyarchaeota archaeon]|nr:cytochrome c biogenesis protein [Candidatus Bathyarchaeota archaeon]